MRFRLKKDRFTLHYEGSAKVWNECLRPYVGGPEAPSEPEAVAPPPAPVPAPRPEPAPPALPPAPAAPAPTRVAIMPSTVRSAAVGAAPPPYQPAPRPAVRTWYPPRDVPARAAATAYVAPEDDEEPEAPRVETSSDPATLYGRLAALPGRRSERDAVLAAAWFLTKGGGETNPDAIEHHFQSLGVFADVKVVPHVLKHVNRTKLLEAGSQARSVRLSQKGVAYARTRLIGN